MFEYSRDHFQQPPPGEPLYKVAIEQEENAKNCERATEAAVKKSMEKMMLLLLKYTRGEIDVRYNEDVFSNQPNAIFQPQNDASTINSFNEHIVDGELSLEKPAETPQHQVSSQKETIESDADGRSSDLKLNQKDLSSDSEKTKQSTESSKLSKQSKSESESVEIRSRNSNIYEPDPSHRPIPTNICDVTELQFPFYNRLAKKTFYYTLFVPNNNFINYIKKQTKNSNQVVSFIAKSIKNFTYDDRYGFCIDVKKFNELVVKQRKIFDIKKTQIANHFQCVLEKVKVSTDKIKSLCFIIDPSKFYYLSISS
ncbi:hypothetical protein QTN25_001300 [Entamoeba marina]